MIDRKSTEEAIVNAWNERWRGPRSHNTNKDDKIIADIY